MKRMLLCSSILISLLLGACGESGLSTLNNSIERIDAEKIFDMPIGVKNGTVGSDIYSAMVLVNISHSTYLDSMSWLDANKESLTDDEKEKLITSADVLANKLTELSFISITEADEVLSPELSKYMINLIKEADNVKRFAQYGDSKNLQQAIEHHKGAIKNADNLVKLSKKYDIY